MNADFLAKAFMLASVLVSGLIALLAYEAGINFVVNLVAGIAGLLG